MPYITDIKRAGVAPTLFPLAGYIQSFSVDVGTLDYIITKLVLAWLGTKPSFTGYVEALGVLEAVKLELYRRQVAPYEDTKRDENGEVFA